MEALLSIDESILVLLNSFLDKSKRYSHTSYYEKKINFIPDNLFVSLEKNIKSVVLFYLAAAPSS